MDASTPRTAMTGEFKSGIVLGLDLGRHLGWALVEHRDGKDTRVLSYGDIDLGKNEDERYAKMIGLMQAMDNPNGFDMPAVVTGVCFEDVQFFRGGAASKQNAGYRAIVMGMCCANLLPFAGVDTSTLKVFATGDGGAKKPEMIEAARALVQNLQMGGFPYPALTDNSADAIHCAMFGATRMGF